MEEVITTAEKDRAMPVTDGLREVDALQRAGLTIQALEKLRALAPGHRIEDFCDPAAQLMAARLTQHCGAPERAIGMIRRLYHRHRGHPETTYYYARVLMERRGPLPALRFLERQGDLPNAETDLRAEWMALRGNGWTVLRDFAEARRWIERARELAPANPWVMVEEAALLEAQDRYNEALETLEKCLERHAGYRPAIQSAAHAYQLLGQDQKALELLRGAAGRMESMIVLMQLSALEQELGMYAEARATMAKVPATAPLMEKNFQNWFDFRRFDLAYWCGDLAAAVEIGAGMEEEFVKETVARIKTHLASAGAAKPVANLDANPPHRVRLNVGFVRQHQLTCVPATLSTLCRYWGKPADHLQIAEAICYDGTPHHKERAWAQGAGYVTREFTLNWEVGVKLIDWGVPFALTTVGPEGGHAQAVIGYDALRETFLIRDPYVRSATEFVAGKMLEHFQSTGPRCLLLLPPEDAGRLEGIELPEAGLYDHLNELQLALERHDRATAALAAEAMAKEGPGHRLTHYANRCLMNYDAKRTGVLAATEELLKLYPNDAALQLSKVALLRDLARREDRVVLLTGICAQKKCQPVFWEKLAEEMLGDARQSSRTVRLLERRLRRTPQAASAFASLAHALWNKQEFERAFVMYRIAACLEVRNEDFCRSYFSAARHFRKTEEALEFLRQRVERFGTKSSGPAQTLFGALSQLDRQTEAFEVLDRALERRPEDAQFMCFAANAHVRYQKMEKGLELLKWAEPKSHRLSWLYAAAEIEDLQCRGAESLALWRQLVEQDPLCVDGHRSIARLLAEIEGRAKALEYLTGITERFPHHFELHQLLIMWEQNEDHERRIATVKRLIALDPNEAWSHRELALICADTGRDKEALEAMATATELEPGNERTINVWISVQERGGRANEAREWARRAIKLSVDNELAMQALIRLAPSTQERRQELELVQRELVQQVIFGDSLMAFGRLAQRVLEPGEVTARLREAHKARPDLWQAWCALINNLAQGRELEEAEKLGNEAVARFPLLPRLWVEMSQVYQAKGELEARAAALEEALAIAPAWGLASRMLATVHEIRSDLAAARRCLEQAIAREPLDPANHGYLAQVLWKDGKNAQAIERLQHALLLNPDEPGAWEMLHHWATREGRPGLALEKLREMTRQRAGNPAAWRQLARVLPARDAEALAAAEKAVALEPRNPENHDLRAVLLAAANRLAEAKAACQPVALGTAIPTGLRARAAWLLKQEGKTQEAITAMLAVVKEDQSNYWSWQRLAEWYQQLQDMGNYLKVCRRVVELWPGDAMALEYLAHALLQTKTAADRAEAKNCLRRALEIDPDRGFSADLLLQLQLEDNEHAAAEETARLIQSQGRPAAANVATARLAQNSPIAEASEKELAAARALFRSPTATPYQVQEMMDLPRSATARKRVEAALLEVAAQEGCNEHVPAAAVRIRTASHDWPGAWSILRKCAKGSAGWSHACVAYLSAAGKARRLDLIKRLMREQTEALRKDQQTWAAFSFAFAECRRWVATVDWMKDVRQRAQTPEPWMLMNLALAYSNLKRYQEAAELHAWALKMTADDSYGGHLIWMALLKPERFLDGAGDGALALEHVVCDRLQQDEKDLLPVAQVHLAAMRAQRNRTALRRQDMGKVWTGMGARFITARKDALVKRMYRRVFWEVIKGTRNPGLWLEGIGNLISLG